MKVVLILAGAVAILGMAQPATSLAAPTHSCNQTLDRCVADRVATGAKPAKAQNRCAEILSKCKSKKN